MLVLIGLIFLLLFGLGYGFSKSFMAPYTLVAGIWAFLIGLYYILSPDFFYIDNKFPFAILIWVIGFYFSSLIGEYLTKVNCIRKKHDKHIMRILYILVILSNIYIGYKSLSKALNGKNVFLYLRMINTGLDENIEVESNGILSYFSTALIIIYLIELLNYSRENKYRFLFLLLLNIVMSVLRMAKTNLFILMFSSLVVLYMQKKIKVTKMLFPFGIFIGLCILFQVLRNSNESINLYDFLNVYIFSGSVAFDRLEINTFTYDGSNVFRLFYAVAQTIGLPVSVEDTILDYVSISNTQITNVYTVLYPYYKDFGCLGVFLFSIINGTVGGVLYKKSFNNYAFLILYAIFSSYIILQFMGEFVFTNASTFLQYIFYACIPFYFKLNYD